LIVNPGLFYSNTTI